ncbi:MAG: peptidylprolyl isomerase [Desulfovibrionales bacterium]|nr:peptidylprolyl isomerase [Desulfovibrionales bacterium]
MALAPGTTVRVHYTGTLDDGTQFDSSLGQDPLEITLGQDMVIPGFEKAITGMTVGQKITVTIPEEEAYGPHQEEMLLRVPLASLPPGLAAKEGEQLILRSPEGQEIPALIVAVDEEEATIDANHPLAGFALTFEIELISLH